MAWFRMHENILDNPKLLRLPKALAWDWTCLLAAASRHRGRLPDWPDLAVALRRSEKECRKVVDSLREAKLLDEVDGALIPHDWNDHQYKSDVSTNRVKAFRERKEKRSRQRDETVSRNASEQSRADENAPTGHSQSAPVATSPPVAPRAPAPGGARTGAPQPLQLSGARSQWTIRLMGHRLGETDWPTEHGAAPESDQPNPNLDEHQRRQWRHHHGLPADWRKVAA